MKWTIKEEQPTLYQERTTSGFAWFPVKLTNNTWIWLESYKEVEVYYGPYYLWITEEVFQ